MGFIMVFTMFLLGAQTQTKIDLCKKINFDSDSCRIEKKLQEIKDSEKK